MAVKYLYIDDEGLEELRGYIRAVQNVSNDELEVAHLHPQRYDKQIDAIRDLGAEVDGIILDFRLDMKSGEVEGEKHRANYRAASIAQEIRSLETEGKIVERPIVLWSLSRRYKKSYSPDETAHDLFDLTSTKESLEDREGAERMASRLIALAEGYQELRRIIDENRQRKRFTYKLLGLYDNPDFLDQRIITRFDNRSALPVHEYARFVLRKMIDHTGPLVDKEILAARLGIDWSESQDWESLTGRFENAEYSGPFRQGWPRWWWPRVDQWWTDEITDEPLKRLTAEERVSLLIDNTGVEGLVPAEPIEEDYSTRFWTVCEAFTRPLDPTDGLRAQTKGHEPWMDRPYISKEAALKRKGEVDPLDDARLQRLKRQG